MLTKMVDGKEVEMSEEEEAAVRAEWAANAALAEQMRQDESNKKSRLDAVHNDADADPLFTALKTATPQEIRSWVAANVTTLPEARIVIAKMAIILAMVCRKQL